MLLDKLYWISNALSNTSLGSLARPKGLES